MLRLKKRERASERETERQRDRETERQRDRETEREREREERHDCPENLSLPQRKFRSTKIGITHSLAKRWR